MTNKEPYKKEWTVVFSPIDPKDPEVRFMSYWVDPILPKEQIIEGGKAVFADYYGKNLDDYVALGTYRGSQRMYWLGD